jgi:hypothetical protein
MALKGKVLAVGEDPQDIQLLLGDQEPTKFQLPRASRAVHLLSSLLRLNGSSTRADDDKPRVHHGDDKPRVRLLDADDAPEPLSPKGRAQGEEKAEKTNGHVEMKEADPLGATVKHMVQGPISPADHAYQTKLLARAREFRAAKADSEGDRWDAHLGDNCNMAVGFTFVGSGTDLQFEFDLTNFEAETIHLLALAHYPDLWPQLYLARSIDNVHHFAPNDFFIGTTSKLPLPMVPGFHNVAQFVKYDLLEDPEGGYMIAIETPKKDATAWRNGPVPALKKGCTRTEVELIAVCLKPTGRRSHNIKIKAALDLKIPRWVLANNVSRWVTNKVAKAVYSQLMHILSDFESTDFAKRAARDRQYFDKLRARLHDCKRRKVGELGQSNSTSLSPKRNSSK